MSAVESSPESRNARRARLISAAKVHFTALPLAIQTRLRAGIQAADDEAEALRTMTRPEEEPSVDMVQVRRDDLRILLYAFDHPDATALGSRPFIRLREAVR